LEKRKSKSKEVANSNKKSWVVLLVLGAAGSDHHSTNSLSVAAIAIDVVSKHQQNIAAVLAIPPMVTATRIVIVAWAGGSCRVLAGQWQKVAQ
jgi:hypothetical protein